MLNPAFAFSSVSSTSTPITSQAPDSSTNQTGKHPIKKKPVGGIVGGVVGGLAGFTVIALVTVLLLRSGRKRGSSLRASVNASGSAKATRTGTRTDMRDPQPFLLEHPVSETMPKGSHFNSRSDGTLDITAPTSSAPTSSVTENSPVARVGRPDEVEAVVNDFANRIQAVLHTRLRGTDEPPPQYTG